MRPKGFGELPRRLGGLMDSQIILVSIIILIALAFDFLASLAVRHRRSCPGGGR